MSSSLSLSKLQLLHTQIADTLNLLHYREHSGHQARPFYLLSSVSPEGGCVPVGSHAPTCATCSRLRDLAPPSCSPWAFLWVHSHAQVFLHLHAGTQSSGKGMRTVVRGPKRGEKLKEGQVNSLRGGRRTNPNQEPPGTSSMEVGRSLSRSRSRMAVV